MDTMRDAAPLIDVLTAGLGVITRSRDYRLLDLEVVQQALARVPDQVNTHPESGVMRALYDCPAVPLTPTGPEVRRARGYPCSHLLAPQNWRRAGRHHLRAVCQYPSCSSFRSLGCARPRASHRGSFETVLADEDVEQDADRWYSHTPCGQEFCPHPRAVGLESAPGTGADALLVRAAHHRICPSI